MNRVGKGKRRIPRPRISRVKPKSPLARAATRQDTVHYTLRLYVAGMTPRSSTAIRNITTICEDHLKGRYYLEVIDIYRLPNLIKGEQIIAVPTLIKKLPLPLKRLIGDLADTDRVLVGLDLKPGK